MTTPDRLDALAAAALRAIANEAARAVTEPRRFHENQDNRQQALSHAVAEARRIADEIDQSRRSLVAENKALREERANFINAAGAVAYAVDRIPPSGSRMTQAAERRMREAVNLMDAALIPPAALHREDGAS